MTRFADRFIAVDWGTTNRRAYLIEGGRATETERDGKGVKAMRAEDYPGAVAAIRSRFGDLPMLLAGMVGSTIGWREVPYAPAPAGLDELAGALSWIDERTAIVPGVSFRGEGVADVMRGEEVQLLGAVAAGLVPPDGLLVQPGTHCKWVAMAGGRIAAFRTAMTGELFALIGQHSVLASQMQGRVAPGAAFERGLAEGRRRDIAAALFAVRAARVLGESRDDADTPSFVSGLLIGADVAARLAEHDDAIVHILADPQLGALYAAAVEAEGRQPHIVDSHAAFIAGIARIGSLTE